MAKPVPEGYHSVTPSFTFKDSKKAIEFYKKAFGATVIDLFPDLKNPAATMHAAIKIGDSIVMLGDEMPGMSNKSAESLAGSPISLFIYVPDVDAAFKRAVDAGATVVFPVSEMFWGDRAGNVKDPFGYQWMIATHKRDMSKEEIRKEAEAFFSAQRG